VNPQQSDPLLAEIQKFLKQSSQGKAAPARPPAVGKVGGSQPATLRRGPVADMPSDRPLDSLAGRHLDTGEVGAGASHLIDDLKRGDAERKQHFDDTFTHKLGSLTDTSSTGIQPSGSAAATIAAQSDQPVSPSDWLPLGTSLADFRRAIMLNEILQRPDDRW
jgi:hypothetical protein